RGKLRLEARADQLLSIRDDLLDAGADDAGLLLQVLAHRLDLALDAAAVLLDRLLDQVAPLAQLPLETSPGPADLALEAVAGGDAGALEATDLVLHAGPAAVLVGQVPDACDHAVTGQD